VPPPTKEDFEIVLQSRIQRAKEQGKRSLGVRSGDLHREVGGYPGSNHRMPLCCAVMREAMREGDAVESSPESGQGASLLIRYCIGRR
jgi:5-methylcytosine-specific restriction protein A